jgi:MFS family permease
MAKKYLVEDFGITSKDFFIILFLLFNALIWYFMTRRIMHQILNGLDTTHLQNLIIWGVHDLTLIGSGVAGSILSDKTRRLRVLYLWILLGTIASALPGFLPITLMHILGISFLWGISFGLGMPSCLAYFADCTALENRGRMSGIIFLTINISAPFIVMLLRIDLPVSFAISTIWRGLGLIMLLLLKPAENHTLERRKQISFTSIFHNKSFLLYLIPWFMFSLIDRFEKVFFEHFLAPDLFDLLSPIGPIVGTIFAFVGGLLSDWVGRKRVVIYGFVSLGLAYAAVGITQGVLLSLYFYSVIDGIAWGVFTVTFFLILWGDLSSPGTRGKYYAIGIIPFFLADFIGVLFVPYVLIPPSAAFSVASLFLFLAVLPLLYVPETLPEKKIELRRLRKYVEKAKKIREKFAEKGAEG